MAQGKVLRAVTLVVALSASAQLAHAVPSLFSGNGHYYETFVADGISWAAANAAAQSLTFLGATGHLATITSAPEDRFVDALRAATPGIDLTGFVFSELWIGGFQISGSPEPGNGWMWVNGEGHIPTPESPGPEYANWLLGEPNNSGGFENFLATGISGNFAWNDEGSPSGIHGYVVEYDTAVPEPGTLALVGLGLAGIASRRRGAKQPPRR